MDRQSHGSSPHNGRTNDQNDELSFLDYLRTAGGTVRDNRPGLPDRRENRDSADRKRRHTGSEPQRREYPYPTYNGRPSDIQGSARFPSQDGNSRDTAIDLTSSPGQPRPQPTRPPISRMPGSDDSRGGPGGGAAFGRRESDIVLPRWQPDNEVTKCPVCDTEFSLLYRRHHCRKCGRVVCNRCSPHRITIPRQYIVQPPNSYLLEDEAAQSMSPSSRGNPALGGGDIVRVCNPCVPDPWTPDTNIAASAPIAPVPPPPSRPPTNNFSPASAPLPDQVAFHQMNARQQAMDAMRNQTASQQIASHGRHNSQPGAQSSLGPSPQVLAMMQASRRAAMQRSRSNTFQTAAPSILDFLQSSQGSVPPISTRYHGHRYSQSSGGGPSLGPFTPPSFINPGTRSGDPRRPSQVVMPPQVPEQSRPRRQVREEDECPVCGEEMPPGDSVRERHIEDCIATRFSSTPTQSSVRPPPAPGTPERDSNTPEGSRPRATSFRPRGMYKSKATEKDCIGADGEPQECIICFEEFEEGDELGTMECWCKFHRDCIRGCIRCKELANR
ncbi:Zinc finger FYVE domain-containing protein 21, partial [Pseudocercospora fuligena]